MTCNMFLRRSATSALALLAFAASAATAEADVTVTSARIQAGKLVVTGTTAARARVRLDGQAAHTATANARGKFKIEAVYLPSDCVISLESAAGGATEAVVANCARGITPRGGWSARASYLANDVVTHDGSSWLATRDNGDSTPGDGADWQLFAAGAAGEAGSAGADGSADGAAAARRDPPTGAAGGDLAGTYPNPRIANDAVITRRLADDAVTSRKIADEAVTTAKIAQQGVTSDRIGGQAVTQTKIAPDAVTGGKVLDETLTDADLAPDSVASSEIQTDAVGSVEIATDSVGSSEIQSGVVGADELDTVHEHFGTATDITDGTAHDGSYTLGSAIVACGFGEDLLSVSVDWTATGGHNERHTNGVLVIDRTVDPETATVEVSYDGGATTATFQPVATCIF